MMNTEPILKWLAGTALALGAGLMAIAPYATEVHAETASSTAPVISGITVTPNATSAVVSWNTDVGTNAQVNYGTSSFYGASTTLDTALGMNHAKTILGLTPNTTYHFQIASANASSTMATSSDQTFTTLSLPPSAPIISGISAVASSTAATISWATNVAADSMLNYGTSASYGSSTTLNTGLVTNHTQSVTGLTPSTTYHFQILSRNASSTLATSTDQTFTTLAAATTTATTTGTTALEDRIAALEQIIRQLEERINALIQLLGGGNGQGNNGNGNGNGGPVVPGTPTIDQNGQTVSAGSTIDFGGHGFAREEEVRITLNGQRIANAHADGGGNFSTGSLRVPTAAGTYTYVFTGQRVGDTANATITVR